MGYSSTYKLPRNLAAIVIMGQLFVNQMKLIHAKKTIG